MIGKARLQHGVSLLELIVSIAIISTLCGAAVPLARATIRGAKERQLRQALLEIRNAIDRYKEDADHGVFLHKMGTDGYPPDLDTLVKGVELPSGGKVIRFLRKIPTDPMTGKAEWGVRSVEDDPQSDSWGGQNVFDIYSKSDATALDGTKYKDW